MRKIKIFQSICFLYVSVIPINSFISVRLGIIALLLTFFQKHFSFQNLLKSWDVFFYFFMISFGLLYTQQIELGLKVIETGFSLIAIPIIFCGISKFEEKQLYKFLYFFIIGLGVANCICLINAIALYIPGYNAHVFFSYQFTDIISSHPTYMAYYLIFAITFGLYILYYKKSSFNPYLIGSVLIFLFAMLMLTGGRTVFISILLVFSFFILRFLIGDKVPQKKITFILVLIMMGSMFLINSVDFENRNSLVDDSWERFALWESAIKATPSILWGTGTGDSKLLNEYYLSHNMAQFAEGSYNAHNQFIQILFTNGIFGLLAVLILIIRPLYLSVKHQNILGVLVFFPFLIYGMTEVFLGRYQGVVFFALLHQCFIAHYQSNTPAFALKGN